jgi:hypothetical protein
VSSARANAGEQVRDFERRVIVAGRTVAGLIALMSVGFGAAQGDDLAEASGIAAAAIVVASAAAGAGTLLGFLFGIPHTLQSEGMERPKPDGGTRYLANTNLEQISDWVTKILVGISLVQIGNAGPALAHLADSLGPMLGDEPASPGFGLALCFVAALSSFLLSYLWTRVRLKPELEIADRDLQEAVREVVEDKALADAEALSLVDRALNGQEGDVDKIAAALSKASKPVLVQAYQRAEDMRARTWRDPTKHEEHARTLIVFRALIANDPELRYHRHFGSLGFALKDREPPDLAGAVEALTTAITVRSDPRAGFVLYEWNRAACRIRRAREKGGLTPDDDAAVEADLRAAAQRLGAGMFQVTDSSDRSVRAVEWWLREKNLTYADLRGPAPRRAVSIEP